MLSSKKYVTCNMAIFFDFDGVLHTTGQPDEKGLNMTRFVDIVLLKEIIQLSIKHNYPLFILTARSDSSANLSYINKFIQSVSGFNKNMGGFHPEDIHCLGVESYSKKHRASHLMGMRQPKLKMLQRIHQEKFPELSNEKIWFIEDDPRHADPVEEAGYSVIKAMLGSKKHLQDILVVIRKNIEERYDFYTMLSPHPLFVDQSKSTEKNKETPLTVEKSKRKG